MNIVIFQNSLMFIALNVKFDYNKSMIYIIDLL